MRYTTHCVVVTVLWVRSCEALRATLDAVGSSRCGAAALRKAALSIVAGAGAGGASSWLATGGAEELCDELGKLIWAGTQR